MSLELALEANTAAVRELVAVWSKLASTAKTVAANVDAGTQTSVTAGNLEIPLTAPKVEEKKSAAPEVKTEPPKSTEDGSTPPSEITYADVTKVVLSVMKTDKPRVMAAVAKFGAKNAKELKPEQWADFVKELS